jgi:ketosteroid isomerase-like protein
MAFLVEHGKVTEFREYTDTAAIAAALAATSAAGA